MRARLLFLMIGINLLCSCKHTIKPLVVPDIIPTDVPGKLPADPPMLPPPQIPPPEMKIEKKESEDIFIYNEIQSILIDSSTFDEFINEQGLKITISRIDSIFGKTSIEYIAFLTKLANWYSRKGRFKESEVYYKSCLSIVRDLMGKSSFLYAKALSNLSIFYINTAQYEESLKIQNEALQIIESNYVDSLNVLAALYNNLGIIYKNMADFKMAENAYLKATSIKLNNDYLQSNYAARLNNLAVFYSYIGNYKKAISTQLEAHRIYKLNKNIKNYEYVKSLVNLGNFYRCIKDFNNSYNILNSALQLQESINIKIPLENVNTFYNIALLYQETNKIDSSLFFMNNVIDIQLEILGPLHPSYAISLNYVAKLMELKIDSKVDEYYIKSISILEKKLSLSHPLLIECQLNYSSFLIENNRYEKGLQYLENVFLRMSDFIISNYNWMNSDQKELFWKKNIIIFEKIINLLNLIDADNTQKNDLLYNCLLFIKSQLLEEKVLASNFSSRIKYYESELDKTRKYTYKIISDGTLDTYRVDSLNNSAEFYEKILSESWPEYAKQKRNLNISWNKVMNNLDSGEAAIEYYKFKDNSNYICYGAIILNKKYHHPKVVNLGREDSLSIIIDNNIEDVFNFVWKPLLPFLEGITTIYYSPVGFLNSLPFHAMILPSDYILNNKKYLIDHYTLHHLISTRYLAIDLKINETLGLSNSIGLIGGVNYNYPLNHVGKHSNGKEERSVTLGGFKFLDGTRKEILTIDSLLRKKKWNVSLLSYNNASENRFVNWTGDQAKSILHIATHGFALPEISDLDTSLYEFQKMYSYRFNSNAMVRSGLLFTGGNWAWIGKDTLSKLGLSENGILTALEFSQLNLKNTKLVVLSACETGLGKIQDSEGTFGLKRAIKLAGVKQMILSLSSVPDLKTSELMVEFYKNISSNVPPAKAFENSQRKMRRNYPNNPEYWGNFVFIR